MKRIFISLFILLIPLLLLSGCSGSSDDIEVVKVWIVDEGSDADEGGDVDADTPDDGTVKKVGMVTDVAGIDDESFNQSAWEGLEELAATGKVKTTFIESESEDDFQDNFRQIADEGCGLCWGVGFACADALLEVAGEKPDVHFAVVDSSYEDTPDNITGVVFRAQEPSFIVGYIAASVTRTGRIGFVGGIPGEIIDQFQYGFQAGVDYASYLYGKKVNVIVEYADSFQDEDKGYEIAKNMYDGGCDVVYHAAGGAGLGVIKAAKECNAYVIGVDRDQSSLSPEHVLTSALKNVNVAVARVSESYLRGEDIGGATLSFGLTEGAVGIPDDHSNYRDEIYDSALMVEDKIKAGEIVPPASAAQYKEFIKTLDAE